MEIIKKVILTLYAGLIVSMAYATFIVHQQGQQSANSVVYHTSWFFILWAIIAVVSLVFITKKKLWKRVHVFSIHLALCVILLGAGISWLTSFSGKIHLRSGIENDILLIEDDKERSTEKLPFTLKLDSFKVESYTGTYMPADFLSYVTYDKGGETESTTISMNNILKIDGYRIYQYSYDEDLKGSILSVYYDPVGTKVTYIGYILFFLSFLMTLLYKRESFIKAIKSVSRKETAVLFILLVLPVTASARTVPTINREKADRLGEMQIIYNGRKAPLNTLATDFLKKIYGKNSYKGLSPEQVIYGWLHKPELWKKEKMIKIKSTDLRQRFNIKEKYASLEDLFDGNVYKLSNLPREELNKKEVVELDEKVGLIIMVTQGELIKPLPKDVQPLSDAKVKAEILYNKISSTKILFIGNLIAGFIAFIMYILSIRNRNNTLVSISHKVIYAYSIISLLALTVLYVIRFYISGRIPMGNGYETMLFLSLCILLIGVIFCRFIPLLLQYGLLLSGFTLLVANLSDMNPQITSLMPVLNSSILCVHVSTIMISYALLSITFLNSLVTLVLYKFIPLNDRDGFFISSGNMSTLMLYPALFTLGVGIFLGAVWANISWGKYWSWDPKETWALITFMVYAVAVHAQSLPVFKKPVFYHTYMILAFLTLLMTYFGVNYVLGGMHSYA